MGGARTDGETPQQDPSSSSIAILNSPFKLRLDYFYDKNLGDIPSVKKDR